MKLNRRDGVWPALMLASVLLSGCNSEAPSASEARKIAENTYETCDQLKVIDFERVNGIPQNDGSYVVQVKYKVRVTLPDDIKSFVRETYPQQLAHAREKAEEAKALEARYHETLQALQAADPQASEQELIQKHPDLAKLSNQRFDPQWSEAENRVNGLPLYTLRRIEQSLYNACPQTRQDSIWNLLERPRPMAPFTDTVEVPLYANYTMIKTDNGWMEAQ